MELTTDQIKEYSRVIAEYDGAKKLLPDLYYFEVAKGMREEHDEGGFLDCAPANDWTLDKMEYHKSWDWLIPVFAQWCDECGALPLDINKNRDDWKLKDKFVHCIPSNNPQSAFTALAEGILWLNEFKEAQK